MSRIHFGRNTTNCHSASSAMFCLYSMPTLFIIYHLSYILLSHLSNLMSHFVFWPPFPTLTSILSSLQANLLSSHRSLVYRVETIALGDQPCDRGEHVTLFLFNDCLEVRNHTNKPITILHRTQLHLIHLLIFKHILSFCHLLYYC